MPNKPILLIDETFHPTFLSSYKATVLLSEKQISVSFMDYVRKKYIYFFSQSSEEAYSTEVIKKILTEQYLNEKNVKSRFIVATPHVQIIPASFYKEENEALAHHFVFNNDEQIHHCPSLYDSMLLFSLPAPIDEILQPFNQSLVYPHIQASIHLANFHLKKNKQKSTVLVHLHESFFEAIVIDNEHLVLMNTYSYQHADDILYFIHLLYQTLSLDKDTFPLVFSGQVDKKDDIIKKAKDFGFNIDYARLHTSNIYSYRFNELSIHRYASLFSISQ